MRNVVIIGAGGHGRVVADIIDACGDRFIGFLDDNTSIMDSIGQINDYKKFDAEFIVAIGNSKIREKIANDLNCKWYTAIHPSAIVSKSVKIGEGTVVMPNVVINSNTVIGKHCIINSGAIVEHDNIIEDYAHISVGAKLGGTVHIGRSTWVGIGAVVKNNIMICSNTIIGAGAVVVKDIIDSKTYIGVPARVKGNCNE